MSAVWLAPRACSVIGAAHRRQGKPCQDASLATTLVTPAGEPLELLAVADGHGSSRSWLSDRGSALACREAERAVAAAVASTPLGDTNAWGQLLREGLLTTIQGHWQAAIADDWRHQPQNGDPLEPVTYGCTLGLLLLAPQWWGCSGLGDWDLVAVDGDGRARLLSEETDMGGGEATASLCLPRGSALWAPRTQLQPLATQPPLRALVLSTDGVRKSCASDADFLALCGQVIHLQSPQELEEGLAQITRQGSGDDVSLAMALRRRSSSWRWPLAAALLLAGAAVLAVVGLVLRPTAPPPDPVLVQQRALCADPSRIRANLTPRRAQLQQLRRDPTLAAQLLAAPQNDPLGALLARSQRGSLNPCPALEQQLMALWRDAGGKMPAAAQRSNERPPAGDRPAAPGSR